ncbi:TonB-dependent siderophore receptor [Sphingomonas sp.]
MLSLSLRKALLVSGMALAHPALANEPLRADVAAGDEPQERQRRAAREAEDGQIIVNGVRESATAATKTDTPLIEIPQPISIIPADVYLAQGALNIADTLRYTAGVQTNAYGLDARVDSAFIRGVTPLQYRDGMREIFGFYNTIVSDPYNFSRVEVVRGPASVLFGQGSIGGLVNLVSKTPQFETAGEVSLRVGSFNRREVLFDVTGPLSPTVAVRLVGRAREADTQTDFIADDRVFVAPSITWAPGERTTLTLVGLYQEDDGGSTQQFLPLDATIGRNEPGSLRPITPNPNGRLPFDTFVGEPGWDRYDGRVLQGTAQFEHRFSDAVTLRARARYIDSEVDYRGFYPNNYTNPFDPWVEGSNRRRIVRIASVNLNESEAFTTDNNLTVRFNTGSRVEHVLIAGVDHSWNRIRAAAGTDASTTIDLYAPVYGNLVEPVLGTPAISVQKQTGVYAQDQIRFADRVSVVLGVRHDEASSRTGAAAAQESGATTFRAGVIGEVGAGISPFVSYTESFLPVAGFNQETGESYRPQRGEQFEAGLKWQPDPATLVTLTGYRIRNTNRLVSDPANPLVQIQTGEAQVDGVELEAVRRLPGDYDVILSYSYNDARVTQSSNAPQVGLQLENVPQHNASVWATKTVALRNDVSLRFGAGVRYVGEQFSYRIDRTSTTPLAFSITNIVRTPDVTLVDALVTANWRNWELSVNANNLLGKNFYAACLARGDCFLGAQRNVFGTLTYRF